MSFPFLPRYQYRASDPDDSSRLPKLLPGIASDLELMSSCSLPKYQYRALKLDDSIRLLTLLPGTVSDFELHICIEHTSLSTVSKIADSALGYSTLSYCWGAPLGHATKIVYIHEGVDSDASSKLLISKNLHSALRHLRKHDGPCTVWADGLCIDQCNLDERNHQVHQMCAIYRQAMKTIAYLGDAGSNTCTSAWNFLGREIATAQGVQWQEPIAFRGDIEDVEMDILQRPWFRRVWVVQEVAVSNRVILQCGEHTIDWDDFCEIMLLRPRINDRYGFSLRNVALIDYVTDLFQTRWAFMTTTNQSNSLPPWYNSMERSTSGSNHILDVVARSRRLQATDPRDKIFALLGISSGVDLQDPRIAVDYSKSLLRVYTDFAEYLIESMGNLDVLSHSQQPHSHSSEWPTWVPDWRVLPATSCTILGALTDERRVMRRYPSEAQSHSPPRVQRIPLENGLVCSGRIVGVIRHITASISLRGVDEASFAGIRRDLNDTPERLRAAVLAAWKKYPWRYDAPLERFDAVSKHDATLIGSQWEDQESCYEVISMIENDYEMLNSEPIEHATSVEPLEPRPRRRPYSVIAEHLIRRSRETIIWNDDAIMAFDVIVDKNSIVDHRRLGTFSQIRTVPSELRIATKLERAPEVFLSKAPCLLPAEADEGDWVVSLTGGNVDFVIRPLSERFIPSNDTSRHYCLLIGECLAEQAVVSDHEDGFQNPTRAEIVLGSPDGDDPLPERRHKPG